MKRFLENVPCPVCGTMLGFAALGNLLKNVSSAAYYACGSITLIIGIIWILKVVFCFNKWLDEMKKPVISSVSAAYPMALMLLSVYLTPFVGIAAAKSIWFAAAVFHIVLIIWFSVTFIGRFDISNVYASWFVVYVGIATTAITAPAYGFSALGIYFFWFAFISLLVLMSPIVFRYIKLGMGPEPVRPLFCIFAAPFSICLTAYVRSAPRASVGFIVLLAVLSCVFYIIVLIRLPKLLRTDFYPSYSAFTFPFVISATAMLQAKNSLTSLGYSCGWIGLIVVIEEIIAALLCTYTLTLYVIAIVHSLKQSRRCPSV